MHPLDKAGMYGSVVLITIVNPESEIEHYICKGTVADGQLEVYKHFNLLLHDKISIDLLNESLSNIGYSCKVEMLIDIPDVYFMKPVFHIY